MGKPLMNKKGKAVLNGYTGIVIEFRSKQISYGQIKEENFTITLQRWLDNNDVLMCSAFNDGKSVGL